MLASGKIGLAKRWRIGAPTPAPRSGLFQDRREVREIVLMEECGLTFNMTSSGENSPGAGSCAETHPPKYGHVVPNRIFVGGIAANTTAQELEQFFSKYGAVTEAKIIADRAGVSKGYGFITFQTQEDADKIIKKEADNLIFKDRKLNIGQAIKKQGVGLSPGSESSSPFTPTKPNARLYETSISPGTLMFANGIPYVYQNGMAFFQSSSENAHAHSHGYPVQGHTQPSAYPLSMMQHHGQALYSVQPYAAYQPAVTSTAQWAAAAAATQAQWRWAPPVQGTTPYMYAPLPAESVYQQQAAYQHELDGVIEASPEGSMVMESNKGARFKASNTGGSMEAAVMTMATAGALNSLRTSPSSTNLPSPGAVTRTAMAYKRPLASASNGYSQCPSGTPPAKIMAAQGLRGKAARPVPVARYDINMATLTPPHTPDVYY